MGGGDPDLYFESTKERWRGCMSNSLFSIAMVILVGLMSGVIVGLLIGFLAKKQRPLWSDMTGAEKRTNILLVGVCSAIFIAGLAWGFLIQ